MMCLIGSKIDILNKRRYRTPLENTKVQRSNSLTGFSLLELLVVVVIIGFILGLSLPRFRATFNNLRFDNFCQNLASRMVYLKERAALEQSAYRLIFDLDNKVIEIEVSREPEQNFASVKGLLTKEIIIPEGMEISLEGSEIIFFPDGTIDGSDIELSYSQSQATIDITEPVGRIELKRM